jgi:predicted dehydrogenase
VIVIATSLHREIAAAVYAAGKHIFCEKPKALSVANCDTMIAGAQGAEVLRLIGFMRRFDEGMCAARA